MFDCLVSWSSAQSIEATKWTEELLVATDLGMAQKVLVSNRVPYWTSFILTFDTGLFQDGAQFPVKSLNFKVFSACWASLAGHQPFGDAMLAINLFTMAAFLWLIDHSFTYWTFEILNDLAIVTCSVRYCVSLFLVWDDDHLLILL